jgi:hypothetical protein
MNKKVIVLGIVVVALGVGGYFAYRKFRRPTKEEFDEMVSTSISRGQDVFEGLKPNTLAYEQYVKGWTEITRAEADKLRDALNSPKGTRLSPQKEREMLRIVTKMRKYLTEEAKAQSKAINSGGGTQLTDEQKKQLTRLSLVASGVIR